MTTRKQPVLFRMTHTCSEEAGFSRAVKEAVRIFGFSR